MSLFPAGIIASVLLSGLAYGQTVPVHLMQTTCDSRAGTFEFILQSGPDKNLVGLTIEDSETPPSYWPLDALKNYVTLLPVSGQDVIRLRTTDFNAHSGGTVELKVLRNFLKNDYKVMELSIRNEGGQWRIYANGQNGWKPFDSMYFLSNKVLTRPVGVKAVQIYQSKEFLERIDF